MLRLVRSAWRTADRFVQVPSSGVRLKPLGNLFHNLKGSIAPSTKSLSSSTITNVSARAPPIQNGFSFPTRVALNRPLSPMYLPRPPAVPRSVTQVGLGTARNFSSTRHVFQNIVDNVPITTRALWEAEWDLKKAQKEEKRKVREMKKVAAGPAKVADKLKANATKAQTTSPLSSPASSVGDIEAENNSTSFSHYFPAPDVRVEGVTTSMEVPLYPPAERLPLPSPADPSSFMPVRDIHAIHDAHAMHSLRVSAIFKRLDAADVWSKGAECKCYGGPMVTSLRVTFTGWTKDMVLEVVGEAGKGWCTVVEERVEPIQPSPPSPQFIVEPLSDSTLSFVIPTLDFSSNFAAHSEPAHHFPDLTHDWTPLTTRPSSPSITFGSDEEFDSEGSDISILDMHHLHPPESIQQTLGFSTDFLSRGSHFQDTISF